MAEPTKLRLPPDLSYPITVVDLHEQPGASLAPGTRLLTYSWLSTDKSADAPPPPDGKPAPKQKIKLFGTWDCSIEGTLDEWLLSKGDVISRERARQPVLHATEPCQHGVQMGGLCALCGKDMTKQDYAGFSDASRATIQMNHTANGPTVSFAEAQRIERETADHLRAERKLSLIVDLDQTVVHATVDPTVGEWIAEGEAWEARQAEKAERKSRREARARERAEKGEDDDEGEGSSSSSDEDDDESDADADDDEEPNPNWEALKDVKRFRLATDGVPASRSKGKERAIDQGCLYYVKPRPGLHEFLSSVATKYEMHVYTMGTRAYAEEVCAAIDPDGKFFGGRLLSRDESGSMTQKSLERLFPVDTSMVVIIDDRADVWGWNANLVKVIPYDFFVGIGDINSAFLPKADPSSALLTPSTSATATPTPPTTPPPPPPPSSSPESSPEPRTPSPEVSAKDVLVAQNSAALESQIEARPLAKLQEEIDEAEGDDKGVEAPKEADEQPQSESPVESGETQPSSDASINTENARPKRAHHKALLNNDDTELRRVQKFLDEIHRRYYDENDKRGGASGAGAGKQRGTLALPSAPTIISRMRSETLSGCTLVFSSVIPLDLPPERAELWRLATSFGAACRKSLTKDVTHLVAAKRGTQKVAQAKGMKDVSVVWVSWLTDSIARWERMPEAGYLLDAPVPEEAGAVDAEGEDEPDSPAAGAAEQISSDPEPDADDWDRERGGTGEPEGKGAVESESKDGESVGTGEGEEGMEDAGEDVVDFGLVAWDDANDELEAFLAEEDSEEDTDMNGEGDGESTGGSAPGTPRKSRKRPRSRSGTPNSTSSNGNGTAEYDDDMLRSPLAKRKRVAQERTPSALKNSTIITTTAPGLRSREGSADIGSPPAAWEEDAAMSEGGTDAGEEEFDFLAGEMEEEMDEEDDDEDE
ncbi:unnamed protein product [Peniophora sp. CBMAI 1063]|nr:unnamed protein product [Peniophora sp. CBMAI 1063]